MPARMLSQELLLKPLLLDALGLEYDKRIWSDTERRDTLYYRGPSTGIYCFNRYLVRTLLRGADDKTINTLTLHDAALVGVVPPSGRNPAHCLVHAEQSSDIVRSSSIYALPVGSTA